MALTPTIRDLLFRMIVDSDRAATDTLVKKVGGPIRIQVCSLKKGSKDLRSIGKSGISAPRRLAGSRFHAGPNVTTPAHRLQ